MTRGSTHGIANPNYNRKILNSLKQILIKIKNKFLLYEIKDNTIK